MSNTVSSCEENIFISDHSEINRVDRIASATLIGLSTLVAELRVEYVRASEKACDLEHENKALQKEKAELAVTVLRLKQQLEQLKQPQTATA